MTLDVADYVKTLFPNIGFAQAAGVVTMYQNYGSNVNRADLVMGECMYIFEGMIAVPDFMDRLSNIRLPHLLSPLSIWRTSLESEFEVTRNSFILNIRRASLQSSPACMEMTLHTTSPHFRKLKQRVYYSECKLFQGWSCIQQFAVHHCFLEFIHGYGHV